MSFIITYLVKRPIVERLLLVFIIVLAIVSAFKIKKLAYPRVNFEQLTITTFYPGASPEDVEVNVTIKLEEALKELEGIEKYISRSFEGISVIDVFIDPDEDNKEGVKSEIRRAIEGVSDLPTEVKEDPAIFEHKMDNYPVFEVALTGLPEKLLREHARQLKKILLDLKSVSKISQVGVRDREYQILLNRNKMNYLEVSFEEVIQAIRRNKIRASGGVIESFTSEKGIVTLSEFGQPKDLEQLIVRISETGGNEIRIKDIGSVSDGFYKKQQIIRNNGKEGISLWATKKKSADVLDAVKEIRNSINDYKQNYAPKGLDIDIVFDDSIETQNRLSIVYSNAVAGFILVILVLFFFLDRKIAFWTAFGIPFSICITLIVMQLFNITINSISLCGLVVVLGMVVDDAIIIAESIYRAKENGMSSLDASIYGLKNVIKPVFGTILTTIIAFTTMYFVPGVIGAFSLEIPSIVIIMLVASFVEASLLLPVHLAHTKNSNKTVVISIPPGQKVFSFLEEVYRKFLLKALRRKNISMGILICFVVVGGFVGVTFTKFNMFPIDQSYRMWIYGKTKKDSNLHYTTRQIKKVEDILLAVSKGTIHSINTTIGKYFDDPGLGSNLYTIRLILTPSTDRVMKAVDIKKFIIDEIKKRNIQDLDEINFYIDGGGPPVGKPVEIKVVGNDNLQRKVLISQLMTDLKKYHVIDIETDYQDGKDELRILPDYRTIAQAQLDVAAVATTIRTAIDGTIVTYLHTPDEKIAFRVMLDEKSKTFDDPLRGLSVRNQHNRLVELNLLVHKKKGKAPLTIYHYKGDRTNTITGNVDLAKTTPKEVYSKLLQAYSNFEKQHHGFKLIIGGEAKESSKMYNYLAIAASVAVIAIYFILIIQFNSFVQPFMVIMAIPFGLVGLLLAFVLHGYDLSILAMIGVIGFAGVVVNDSLVMVDFINRKMLELQQKKRTVRDAFINAIVDGAVSRLRPILLTTITTIAGLVPTAYGLIGGLDTFISPMVLALTWGLLVGTTATLFAIPVLYLFVHRMKPAAKN